MQSSQMGLSLGQSNINFWKVVVINTYKGHRFKRFILLTILWCNKISRKHGESPCNSVWIRISEYEQGSFIYEMERAPFKSLLWKSNYSIDKLTVSITGGVCLWDRPSPGERPFD